MADLQIENVENIGSVKAGLQDITECVICLKTFKNPIILPCIHTFCLECLEGSASSTGRNPGDCMPCPMCRKEFTIPLDGYGALPKNFFMDRLVEMMKIFSPSTAAYCEPCAEDNESSGESPPSAEKYCIECRQKMCSSCSRHHQKIKATKSHRLVEFGGKEFEMAVSQDEAVAPILCECHPKEPLKFYCSDCRTVACAVCYIDTHTNHSAALIDKIADTFRQQIQGHIENIGSWSADAEGKVAKFERGKCETLKQIKDLEDEIVSTRDEIKTMADGQTDLLLRKLDLMKQEKVKEVQTEVGDFERQMTCLSSFKAYCSEMLSKGSASDVCRAANHLNTRAAELQDLHESLMQRELRTFHATFKKTSLIKEGQSIVGTLEEAAPQKRRLVRRSLAGENLPENGTQEMAEYKAEAVLVHSIETHEESTKEKEIWGVAVLDDELFVVRDETSEVDVHDANDFAFKRRWKLKELIDPQDMVACNKHKCLYIMNWQNSDQSKEILRVDSRGRLKSRWSTGKESGRLSVCDDGHLIVAVMWENKLNEYDANGRLVREISLPDIRHPRHAVKLRSGRFVVSYGEDEDSNHGVCVVDEVGVRVASFGGQKGSSQNQVNCPLALSVDDEGSVIVADEKNGRILLLGNDMEFRKVIATEKCGVRDPWRIYLDGSSGRLFVADNRKSGKADAAGIRILVLDVK